MLTRKQKHIRRQLDLLRQAQAARLTRREAIKMGIVTGGAGILNTGAARGQTNDLDDLVPSSPSVRGFEFTEEMPIPPIMQPVMAYGAGAHPSFLLKPHDPTFHQYWNRFPAKKYYYTRVQENKFHNFHSQLPRNTIWGFDGTYPGTTIDLRYGQPVVLRIKNELPPLNDPSITFGVPQTINHLHNFHTAPESDGCPWDYADPGEHNDNHYTMARAGFTENPSKHAGYGTWHDNGSYGGDARETLSFVFTHQHRPEFTAALVYKGQAKVARIFDEKDTGDETKGYRLPNAGYSSSNGYGSYDRNSDFDVPIVIADKLFDPETGELVFDQFATDGFLGDHLTVNGKIQPYFNVKRRKYRFRLLNIGPARLIRLVLRYAGKNQPFIQIGSNGNLLERPIVVTQSENWVAERDDVIIDFRKFPKGAKVYLSNNMAMDSGRKADRDKIINPDSIENQLLEFRVGDDAPDYSVIPTAFRPFPDLAEFQREVVRTRNFRFERTNGMWAINGNHWDEERDHNLKELANPQVQIQRNTAEKWILESSSGGWHHPVHIHFEEGQVLRTDGKAPKVRTRQDVYRVGRDHNRVELLLRFRDFPEPNYYRHPPKTRRPYGPDQVAGQPPTYRHPNEHSHWVMHCHNLTHEDHAMMQTFHIIPKATDV